MKITVLRDVQERNKVEAGEIQSLLRGREVCSINLMGGAGCGKTTLLEHLIPELGHRYRCAVLEGDITTTVDAERIGRLGVPVIQLQTDGCCHLDARLVMQGLRGLPLEACDFVFVENVGNLVCPAEFDIGEHARLAVLSVTEGHDKPAKYPLLFTRASATVITKTDLTDHTDFDFSVAEPQLRQLNPDAPVFRWSSRDDIAPDLVDWCIRQREQVRRSGVAATETQSR